MKILTSKHLFQKFKKILVGGVNSPVRAFGSVGGTPLVIKKGEGSKIYDEDNNSYIDFVNSWGPIILGHAYPPLVSAIQKTAEQGTSFGAPTVLEYFLSQKIQKAFPSMQKIRLVNSGTEATQSAIRLARGFTGRDKIIKFQGCYHGHSDSLLVPSSQGIPESVIQDTLVLSYNDEEELEEAFKEHGNDIAAIMIEPIAANMGVVFPRKNYLKKLEAMCKKFKSLLIFDEVITGFRVDFGGAQKIFKIKPDLTCLGKIIGGGLPVGAYGGREEVMNCLAPLGKVYQAGTLAGNPLAMTAGLVTLQELAKPGIYRKLHQKTAYFCQKLSQILKKANSPCQLNWATGLFTLFFNSSPIYNFDTASASDTKAYARFFHFLLEEGIYFPPSQFEASFISLAHTKKDSDVTLEAIKKYFKS